MARAACKFGSRPALGPRGRRCIRFSRRLARIAGRIARRRTRGSEHRLGDGGRFAQPVRTRL